MRDISICPTITAYSKTEYSKQMNQIKSFASRVHIDLMDGQFVPTKSPELKDSWWFDGLKADVHIMYQEPLSILDQIKSAKPNLAIIHIESKADHAEFANVMHENGIKAGLALLKETPVDKVNFLLNQFDHVLIFSGHLGYHGGQADLKLLSKVTQILKRNPNIEIGWDGGINDKNISKLVDGGVKVLNVGGYIQDSTNPFTSYAKLKSALR